MYWLRIGSLLDLSIIAAEDTTFNAAKSFEIPNSTMAGYITGVRNIRESAVHDLASRWVNYFNSHILQHISGWQMMLDFFFERSAEHYFTEMFEKENRLRLIYEPMQWNRPFRCCAAQVLAQFEGSHPDAGASFTSENARQLLRLTILHNEPHNEADYQKMLSLALEYILWRVKNREYYGIFRRYGPDSKDDADEFEVRNQRKIPLTEDLLLPAPVAELAISPVDMPILKKAATLDALLLCPKVTAEINQVDNISSCSCVSPFGKEIRFAADKLGAHGRRESTSDR